VKNALGVPDMWLLDGVRCGDCKIDSIEPETDGIEEALLVISVTETNGVYSVDTASLEVVAFSSSDEGYYPPVVPLQTYLEQLDVGMARWHRIRELLEVDDAIVNRNPIKQILAHSVEVPPSVAAFDPDPPSDQARLTLRGLCVSSPLLTRTRRLRCHRVHRPDSSALHQRQYHNGDTHRAPLYVERVHKETPSRLLTHCLWLHW